MPFSEKKKIPRNSEQVGTDGSSVGIPPVSRKRKTSEFHSEPFLGRETPSEFCSEPFIGREKPSEFRSEPFLGRENSSEFRSEPFLDVKNLGIPFRIIFGTEKTSEFRSKSFSEEKNLGKGRLLLAVSLNFNISQNSVPFRFVPSYGMDSSEILGITRNEHFVLRNNENRSESIPRNFFGTKFRWQP